MSIRTHELKLCERYYSLTEIKLQKRKKARPVNSRFSFRIKRIITLVLNCIKKQLLDLNKASKKFSFKRFNDKVIKNIDYKILFLMQSPSFSEEFPFLIISHINKLNKFIRRPSSCFESIGVSGVHNPNLFFPKKILKVMMLNSSGTQNKAIHVRVNDSFPSSLMNSLSISVSRIQHTVL